MTNAKDELLVVLEGKAKIKCASIQYGRNAGYMGDDDSDPPAQKTLKVNHIDDDFKDFLASLDFKYDSGYGGQELYGIVWLEDNSWLSRGEYDGSEWWQHNTLPSIASECI